MNCRRLADDRRATAGLEFALVLPVMLLSGLGLVDGVRANLLAMDVEMAVNAGVDLALHAGARPDEIARAMMAEAPIAIEPHVMVFACNGKVDNGDPADNCTDLPAGHYVSISATARRAPLLAPLRPARIRAVALARLS